MVAKNWTYDEGKALIAAYDQRKEEYFCTRNKKDFWKAILMDLEAMGVLATPTTPEQVEVKWRTLYRAYKSVKDRGKGPNATKFLLMNEMDAVFHNKYRISSPNSVKSEKCIRSQPIICTNPQTKIEGETLLDVRKQFYKARIEEKRKAREFLQSYLERKEQNREQRHIELLEALSTCFHHGVCSTRFPAESIQVCKREIDES